MGGKRVLVVFGTRPEAIKLAPVIEEMKRRGESLECRICVTAQHRELLDQVLESFSIVPDIDLNLMRPGQSLFGLTSSVLGEMERVIARERPDLVVVQGDTTTVFATALSAFYLKIPVGHVEAGLRTYVRYDPFPEEMNRAMTTLLADLHFAPTRQACENLLSEGISETHIFLTGNPVVDALKRVVRDDYAFATEALRRAPLGGHRVILLTTHRRESWGESMRGSLAAVREIVESCPDLLAVFPMHPGPAVREAVRDVLQGSERFVLVEPLPYLDFVHLMARSYLILTDSGGVQEEAPTFGVPVLVLRDTTERPEGIEAGTARLVGTSRDRIVEAARELIEEPGAHARMARASNPYGDGHAAERIVDAIVEWEGE